MSKTTSLTDVEAELIFNALQDLIESKQRALAEVQGDSIQKLALSRPVGDPLRLHALTERDFGIPQLRKLLQKLGNAAEITYSGALE